MLEKIRIKRENKEKEDNYQALKHNKHNNHTMTDLPRTMRRRSRSEVESHRRSLHQDHTNDEDEDDDEDRGTFRRRVVSFTCPSGGSSSYLNQNEGISDAKQDHGKADEGEDLPDGLFRKADAGRDGKSGGIGGGGGGGGGFRRRFKSISFGLSLSPASSSHDVRSGGHEGATATAGGKLVTSLVRQSLLQAAWPLSVSLEDIEDQQSSGHHHHQQER